MRKCTTGSRIKGRKWRLLRKPHNIAHMTGTSSAQNNPEGFWNTSNPRTQDAFVCEGSPEMLDVSIEDGARLLEFVVSDERLTGLQVHNISWQSSDI
jgi:hypothetical protein